MCRAPSSKIWGFKVSVAGVSQPYGRYSGFVHATRLSCETR